MAGVPWRLRHGVAVPGEESCPAAVAAEAIEAQPSFGQIKPFEDACARLPVTEPGPFLTAIGTPSTAALTRRTA